MENFLGNGAAQASVSSSSVGDLMGTTLLRAPNEASIFTQPREPILQFTWLKGKKGANNTYECKFCRRRINGQPAMVYAHFSDEVSSQRISGCQRKEDWPPLLTEQIRKAIATRIAEQTKKDRKRSFSKVAIQPVINQALSSMSRPSADAAIMQYVVLCGIAPSIVEVPVFRNMITALRDAGPCDPHSCTAVRVPAYVRFGSRTIRAIRLAYLCVYL